jgi:hypothetical protein
MRISRKNKGRNISDKAVWGLGTTLSGTIGSLFGAEKRYVKECANAVLTAETRYCKPLNLSGIKEIIS